MHKRIWLLSATAAVVTVFGSPAAMAAASTTTAAANNHDYKAACTTHPARGQAACLALIRTNVPAHKGAHPFVTPSGYGPAQLQSAYNLPSSTAGGGATVALVDAYDDPNAESDLAVYRSQFGLPACTTMNGCFQKVNENGLSSPLPPTEPPDDDWATEESLDMDMVSAACPLCHIDLVEANSADIDDLGTGVDAAVTLGAQYVSNSYGASDSSGESASDVYYNHPGVAVTASAGDSGYGVSYPAASPDVVSVGGTSLNQVGSAWTESVWGSSSGGEGTGSGCSAFESKPSWQTDSGCSNRTDNDVAAVADPNTGVAVYDTYDQDGWLVVGGTSASSPFIASVYALAGLPSSGSYPADYLYNQHTSSNINDVTTGADGSCTPAYLCTAEVGYDGPTGWGTPNGVSAFKAPASTPPPPVVTGISPGSGPAAGGTGVTVTGTGLSGGSVAFGPNAATGVSCAATSCTATSPAGTGTVDVKVTTSGGTSAATSADQFTYTAALPTGPIKSRLSGKCVDDLDAGRLNGNKIDIYSCNGTGAQKWIVETNGSLTNAVNGKCITVRNGGRANGTPIVLHACNGSRAQVWKAIGGHLVNPVSSRCMTAPSSRNRTQLIIRTCGRSVNQEWTLP
jgi:Ricin-type beta-trefoil lectin domain/IPT/TIG domain